MGIESFRRTLADDVVADYFRRTGQPTDMERDAAYQLQWATVRRMLARLEEVLGGLGFTPDMTRTTLTAMLDDPPNAAAAEERMREREEAVRRLMERPPAPIVFYPQSGRWAAATDMLAANGKHPA